MRTTLYSRHALAGNGPEPELLRKAIEDRGDTVIATFRDDPTILGKGKYAGWQAMVGSLDQADLIIVGSAGDLPGRTVQDLLKILATLCDHGVDLAVHREGINTGDGPAAVLGLIKAYRAAKLSEAIRHGISTARKAGKVIGRPAVPDHVRRHIQIAIGDGRGIRPTARRFAVSPASVINIRRMMRVEVDGVAA